METSVDQLTPQDFKNARAQFETAREKYDQLHTEARSRTGSLETGSAQADIFKTLRNFYDMMTEAANFGYIGLDSLLEEDDISQAFSRSPSAFEQMEETYNEALELRKEINLCRDTTDTTPTDIVGTWVSDNKGPIQHANSRFEDGKTRYSEREDEHAHETFADARTAYSELLSDVNSEFATTYPRESELYQLFGDVSIYFSRMRDVAKALANSADLRADANYQDAVAYEQNAREAYPEAIEGWEQARKNISSLESTFELPTLPQFGDETDPVASQAEAESIVRTWLDEHEDEMNAQSNYLSVAEDEYADERFGEAQDWYASVAEKWGKLETSAENKAGDFQYEYLVETFNILQDYFRNLRKCAETMQQAASAQAAGRDTEATDLEEEASVYSKEAESLQQEINERVPEQR
jgi:hypothetical protein